MPCQTVNILKILPLAGKHILFSRKQQREYCGNLILVQTTHIMVSTKQFDQNIQIVSLFSLQHIHDQNKSSE